MNTQRDSMMCRGHLMAIVRRASDNEVLARIRQRNLVVSTGRNQIRDLLYGDSIAGITHLAVGTSNTPAGSGDTTLGAEVFRDALTAKTKASAQLTVQYYLASTDANGNTLREAGLFNASSSGVMHARAVLAAPITKTSLVTVTFVWDLTWGV